MTRANAQEKVGFADSGAYLTGRHAVVTGGGRGIGATIAAELARLGCVTAEGRPFSAAQVQRLLGR